MQGMGKMSDGSVYVYTSAELSVIDKAAKGCSVIYDIDSNYNGFFRINKDNVMYYSDSSAVRKYDLNTGEGEVVFKWLDCDIRGDYIYGVLCEEEEVIYAYYREGYKEDSFVKLVKTDRSQIKAKKIITIATLGNYDSNIANEVIEFNKAKDVTMLFVQNPMRRKLLLSLLSVI